MCFAWAAYFADTGHPHVRCTPGQSRLLYLLTVSHIPFLPLAATPPILIDDPHSSNKHPVASLTTSVQHLSPSFLTTDNAADDGQDGADEDGEDHDEDFDHSPDSDDEEGLRREESLATGNLSAPANWRASIAQPQDIHAMRRYPPPFPPLYNTHRRPAAERPSTPSASPPPLSPLLQHSQRYTNLVHTYICTQPCPPATSS